jgi:hypothetical protein
MFFGNQTLEARVRSRENQYRNDTVVDRFDFEVEAVKLQRAANWRQRSFDRFNHLGSMWNFAVAMFGVECGARG